MKKKERTNNLKILLNHSQAQTINKTEIEGIGSELFSSEQSWLNYVALFISTMIIIE